MQRATKQKVNKIDAYLPLLAEAMFVPFNERLGKSIWWIDVERRLETRHLVRIFPVSIDLDVWLVLRFLTFLGGCRYRLNYVGENFAGFFFRVGSLIDIIIGRSLRLSVISCRESSIRKDWVIMNSFSDIIYIKYKMWLG